jgi:hypothetical protein
VTIRYALHGLRIASQVPLPEPEAAFAGPADLVIRRAEPRSADRVPDDVVELRCSFDDEHVYYEGFRDGEERWCIRAPGAFTFSVEGTCATTQPSPDLDEALLPLLAAGMGLAFVLALRGSLCLHASAVERGGRAVALTAPSGGGKSTLAALAAVAGYPLVTDDLLRVDLDSGMPGVFRGASEIRLRSGAARLREHWPGRSRIAADGRTAVAPPRTVADRLPLAAIVWPLLDRELSEVAIERLRPSEAFSSLFFCPRLLGWRYPPVVARQFEQLTALAAEVPVLVARVPWGAPAAPEIGAAVIERVLDAC